MHDHAAGSGPHGPNRSRGCPPPSRLGPPHGRGSTLSTTTEPTKTTFRELGILPETAEALESVGIIHPFPIQEMTLPVALTGHDVIGQAKTGTGKTLGFGLPLIERVVVQADVDAGRATEEQLSESPQALIVVPTRELCTQVTNDLQTAGKVRNVRVLAVYGGRAYEPQVEALKKGVDIVVGTPGRLLDLAGQRKLDLSKVRALVLDEADEMLDLGFLPDVEKILGMLPARRQSMLFSATMPGQVISLARRYMNQPTHIRAAAPDDTGATVASVEQHIFRAHSLDKVELVSRILQADGRGLAMIFCRTKRTAADVSDQLTRRGFAAGAVHGDLGQGAREQALRAFRNGKVDVLVCTDVAARGIDVEGVTHVINYQCPEDEKTYLHRIGRTGRAGASGTAVTLVDWDDVPRWQLINKALELSFNDPEETYSTSAHLYELLKIAPDTKGVLPRSERTRAGLAAEEVEDLGETGGRGPRTGGRGERPRGGRSGGRGEAAAPAVEEKPARAPRERRRTRGGASAGVTEAAEAAPVVEAPAAPAQAPASAAVEGEPAPRRRRRRPRGAAAGESGPVARAVQAPAATSVAPATVPSRPERNARVIPSGGLAPAAKAAVAPAVETPAQPVVETPAPAAVEAAPAVVPAQAPAPAEETTATKPRATRTRKTAAKKVAATAPEATAPEAPAAERTSAEEAPAAPVKKATRTRKTAAKKAAPATEATEAAQTPAAEAVEAVETVTKPRKTAAKRTAKKVAATAPEATAPEAPAAERTSAEEAPAAPVKKATRTRKTAAKKATPATEATEAAQTPAAEEKPAPRRRTRKAAAPAEEAPAAG
ncbi:DEAD/DEAH box helicase [Kitasatospora sp. NPDC052896]|uniref:DEAD/DEAH box helicase n=1 Tax=Kitasatospora sp. NPDC052896 TaxID=3364061 RepID=UPI0037C560EE